MRCIFLIFLFLITPQVIIAQDSKAYKDLHRELMSELAASDVDYAFIIVDSLRSLATSEQERIKADQVLAYLHYQKGDKVTALTLAMENEERFRKNRDYTEQLGVIGFIASNFKELQLFSEANFYLDKAEKSLDKLPNANLKAQFGTLIYHEKVDVSLNMGKLRDASKYIKKVYEYVYKIQTEHVKKYFLAVTLEKDALLAFKTNSFDKAFELNMSALDNLESKDEILYGMIQLNLARIALVNKDFDVARQHIVKAEDMVESSQFFGLKKKLHKTYVAYYDALGLDQERLEHESIYASLLEAEMEDVGLSANFALLKIRRQVNKYRYGLWGIIGLSGVIILSILSVIYYRNKSHHTKDALSATYKIEEIVKESANSSSIDNIAQTTEDRIFGELIVLEKNSQFFLEREISISSLANNLDTNTKYLAHVIKKYRDKNFNTYINDLRIDYIISNLTSDSKFRKYKISYLAKISGFSSHSKFSSEFRRKIGKSPSRYISELSQKS